jgi:hypothetical protein
MNLEANVKVKNAWRVMYTAATCLHRLEDMHTDKFYIWKSTNGRYRMISGGPALSYGGL